MKQILFSIILSLVILSSCTVSKEQVGNYNDLDGKVILYEKNKNFYLFWDLVPVKRIEKKLTIPDYEIVLRRTFFDALIYGGTIGIFSYYTVKIMVKESEEGQNSLDELNNQSPLPNH